MGRHFDYALFGLEPRDIIIYETMLSMPDAASIRTIASSVNMNRGTTFEVIKKLVKLGLATSHYKNKRKFYAALTPDVLEKLAETHGANVEQEIVYVKNYANELRSKKTFGLTGQFTRFYDGEEEIAALLRDVLNTTSKLKPKQYQVISSAEIRNRLYGKFRNFTRQRIKNGVFAQVIAIGEGGEQAKLSERRWLSAGQVPACYIIIYGDKVAQISLSETGNVQGVVVQNAGVAQLQRVMFEHLWSALDGES